MLELVGQAVDLFLHLDHHLQRLIQDYGTGTYLVLSLVIFCETGLVVTPFLPGDSLLFAAGAFAASGSLDLWLLLALLTGAAVVGNMVNYWIGRTVGQRLVRSGRVIKQSHLDRTHAFYERYGPMTIVLTRFVPIVRTVAPFVAGLGTMPYGKFMLYNLAGGVLWVFVCTLAGYVFGNLPVVRDNFELVILGIIALSVVPPIVEALRHRLARVPVTPGDS
jgi:membrane-associated protein